MHSLIILEQGIFPFHSCEIVVWNRLRRSHTVCWWSGNWLEFSELELPVKTGFHLVISNKAKPPNFVVLKLTYPSVLQLVYQEGLTCSWIRKPENLPGDPYRLSGGNPPRETADLCMAQSSHQGIGWGWPSTFWLCAQKILPCWKQEEAEWWNHKTQCCKVK